MNIAAASLSDILGIPKVTKPAPVEPTFLKTDTPVCSVTGQELSPERVQALVEMGVPPSEWTHQSVADKYVRRKKGLIADEDGTMVVCNGVGGSISRGGDVDEEKEKEEESEESGQSPSTPSSPRPASFSLPRIGATPHDE